MTEPNQVNISVGQDPQINYTVKELLAKQDGKLDAILISLAQKADKSEVDALRREVDAVKNAAQLSEERVRVAKAAVDEETARRRTELQDREAVPTRVWGVRANKFSVLTALTGLIIFTTSVYAILAGSGRL